MSDDILIKLYRCDENGTRNRYGHHLKFEHQHAYGSDIIVISAVTARSLAAEIISDKVVVR